MNRLEPAGRSELGEQIARLLAGRGVVRRLGQRLEQPRRELRHLPGELDVLVVEKRADRSGVDDHVNLGSRFA